MSQRPARQALTSGLAVAALGLLTACGPAGPMDASAAAARSPYAVASESAAPAAAPPTATSAPSVAPLSRRLRPDVVVTGKQSFSAAGLARLTKLSPRYGAAVYRAGTVHINGRPVQAVAVDPSTFRRFTAQGTAEADLVWESVARGEAVLSHALATSMSLGLGGEAPAGPSRRRAVPAAHRRFRDHRHPRHRPHRVRRPRRQARPGQGQRDAADR